MVYKFSALTPTTKAAILMMIAVLFFSIMDALAKGLSLRYPSLEVVWARYAFQTILSFLVLAPKLPELLQTKYPRLQLVRSGFLFCATISFFFAIKFMPLAAATALFEVAPLFIVALAVVVLKEKVGLLRWSAVVVGLIGALVIVQPGTNNFDIKYLLPLCAAFFFACYAISTRFLGQEESPFTSFLYTGLIGTILATLLVPFVWVTPTFTDFLIMIAIGAGAAVGHFLLIRALYIGEASFLAPFAYCSLMFNALWGFLFYAEIPSWLVIFGSVIIIGAGLFAWNQEKRKAKPIALAEEPLI